MPKPPTRRSVLHAATAVAATSLAGCLWGNEETQGSNLFLENTKGSEQVVQLIVSSGESVTDDRTVDAWYRVPEDVALELGSVLESGQTYTIGMQAAGEPSSEHVRTTVEPCENEGDGTRDVSVRVRDEGHGIIPWGCDEEYTERDLEYRDAEEHRAGPPEDEEPWTSPTPGAEDDDGDGST